jgi:hypothetical protein
MPTAKLTYANQVEEGDLPPGDSPFWSEACAWQTRGIRRQFQSRSRYRPGYNVTDVVVTANGGTRL